MKLLPARAVHGSMKAKKPFLIGIGSKRIVLILLLLINVILANGQKKSSMSVGMFYSLTNLDKYPVAFSSDKILPPAKAAGLSIEFHHILNRHLVGFKFSYGPGFPLYFGDTMVSDFSLQTFSLGYGQQIKLSERIYFRPQIYLGMLSTYVIYTNENNNSLQAISSGNTQEIGLSSTNPSIQGELEFILKFPKKWALGFYAGYQNGIFETAIENRSGKRIPNAKFNPTALSFGLKFYSISLN